MANELTATVPPGGQTLYAIIFNDLNQRWNTGTNAFDSVYTGSNYQNYAISLAEDGGSGTTGRYAGSFPTRIPAGLYDYVVYAETGSSPAAGDTAVYEDTLQWDGAAPFSSVQLPAKLLRNPSVPLANNATTGTIQLDLTQLAGSIPAQGHLQGGDAALTIGDAFWAALSLFGKNDINITTSGFEIRTPGGTLILSLLMNSLTNPTTLS